MQEMTIDPALAGVTEKEAVKEVFPGMTVEEIRAIYFNADALKEPDYRLYQLNSEGYRYYYRFGANGEPEFFPSVTTLLKQVMHTPPALLDWMIANGKEGSTEKRDLAAAYGTFMHGQFEQLIINRRYDFDNVPVVLLDYMERENIPESLFNQWIVKIRKDVLAFAQFMRDWNVKPLAVEIGLVHPEYRYAGCLDLPCEMTDAKTGKTFRAIVDFKSGRKGFYEEHELQLHLYKGMWNVNYPDIPVTRVFNFSPKDWRKAPSYNLKDQTDSENVKKLPHLLNLAAIEDAQRDNTLTIIRGVLELDKGKISDNILTLSLGELIKTKSKKDDTPEQAATAPGDESHENGQEKPQISTRKKKTANDTENAERPAESKKPENLPVDDVCEDCDVKDCDYRIGRHEECHMAMKREEEAEKAKREDFVQNHLPWESPEQEPAPEAPAPEPEPAPQVNLLEQEIEF